MAEIFKTIVEQEESTIIAHYEPTERDRSAYQGELAMENKLIKQLVDELGYEHPIIRNEEDLLANIRKQLERLNNYVFTDKDWNTFLNNELANAALTIKDKTAIIQDSETVLNFTKSDGETQNITLIDKNNLYNNIVQVINQYVPEGGKHANRYDVTILVNGLPMVQIELKRRGVDIREAFNQINRYHKESYWAGKALFEYVQLFVISNGTFTRYYSNSTRQSQIKEIDKHGTNKKVLMSNSYEFTSAWSDEKNKPIEDLEDFATHFLKKSKLLKILTRYCVFTVARDLMVMRPYQIAATEKILLKIDTAIKNRWQGTKRGGGYIWHTTGSGKTLTSFKTAQLATKIKEVKKVLFVVDRQDLDYQTMVEFNKFKKDSVNATLNWNNLYDQLRGDSKIIVTTIQKLSTMLKKIKQQGKELELLNENVVFIFDECHRSQFGDMHKLIVKNFKKYMMFGFTGTPIFAKNASILQDGIMQTTAQVFGGEPDEDGKPTKALHQYTIVNAIRDNNVLKFNVDYVNTIKLKDGRKTEKVWGIKEEEALDNPVRRRKIVEYILHNYDIKTMRSHSFTMSYIDNVEEVIKKARKVEEHYAKKAEKGFNAIFAVDSVQSAMEYYKEFIRQQEGKDKNERLKIATIFSYLANESDETGVADESLDEVGGLKKTEKEFLNDIAIDDYNHLFGVKYDTSSDKFSNYYKDVSLRTKNKEIDLLIVVGMFLTGFDAKTLNTLWVDKNLRLHGLLQAYSRTNRIFNSVKKAGNIICFRDLEDNTNECFALFGDENAKGIALMKTFNEYYKDGYTDDKGNNHEPYVKIANEIKERFSISHLYEIYDMKEKKEFIGLFGHYLKLFNVLLAYDEFTPETLDEINEVRIIKEGELQDYKSFYIKLHDEFRKEREENSGEKESILDDVVFEMELVKQVQIDITYILALVKMYHDSQCKDKELLLSIRRNIDSSPDMRDKKELIEQFIERINTMKGGDVFESWEEYITEQKRIQLEEIIKEENLKPEETDSFMQQAFKDGYVDDTGTGIVNIMKPMRIFGGGGNRAQKKATVIEKLKLYFKKFFDI